jgi:hypothetical protein
VGPINHRDNGSLSNLVIHRDDAKAISTEFKAGKIVRPISKAKGRGQKGARNLTQASMPEIARTKPSHRVLRRSWALAKGESILTNVPFILSSYQRSSRQ